LTHTTNVSGLTLFLGWEICAELSPTKSLVSRWELYAKLSPSNSEVSGLGMFVKLPPSNLEVSGLEMRLTISPPNPTTRLAITALGFSGSRRITISPRSTLPNLVEIFSAKKKLVVKSIVGSILGPTVCSNRSGYLQSRNKTARHRNQAYPNRFDHKGFDNIYTTQALNNRHSNSPVSHFHHCAFTLQVQIPNTVTLCGKQELCSPLVKQPEAISFLQRWVQTERYTIFLALFSAMWLLVSTF